MATAEHLRAVTNYIEAYNRRDVEAMLANCADDYETESIAYQKSTQGKFACYELVKASFGRWARSGLKITNMIPSGEEVAAELVFAGIKVGSSKTVSFRQIAVFEFRGGLIARDRWYHDRATLQEQLQS